MNDYEYGDENNEMEDVPFIQLELDIKDCYQIYRALEHHEKTGEFDDEFEKERVESCRDFFYRMILEYKYTVD